MATSTLAGSGWQLPLLLAARSIAAFTAPVMDCDETFNFWEPLHYSMLGTGLQTWEYSAGYALRTYAYILMHRIPELVWSPRTQEEKVAWYFMVKGALGAVCAVGEWQMCSGIEAKFGKRVAWITVVCLVVNAGMYHSAGAMLPSSMCMYAVMGAYAAWMREWHLAALVFGAFAVLVCWPFCALMFVPIGLHALAVRGFLPVLGTAVASCAVFVGVPVLIDSQFYGKTTFAIGNLILYNALGHGGGGQGANLYGEEPWYFYLQNLALNFNLIAVLALICPVILVALHFVPWESSGEPKEKQEGKSGDTFTALLYLSGTILTFALFTAMAHKEERFLSICYPVFCFAAALTLSRLSDFAGLVRQKIGLGSWFTKLVTFGIIALLAVAGVLGISRSASLHINFFAPVKVFQALGSIPGPKRVCMAKEWYRFPGSFFLENESQIVWLKSSFNGQLPQPFSPMPEGPSLVHDYFNDRNEIHPSSLGSLSDCDYAVDLDVGFDNGDIGDWQDGWEKVVCFPFLDSANSPAFIRSFYIPFGFSMRTNKYVDYCLLKRVVTAP